MLRKSSNKKVYYEEIAGKSWAKIQALRVMHQGCTSHCLINIFRENILFNHGIL